MEIVFFWILDASLLFSQLRIAVATLPPPNNRRIPVLGMIITLMAANF